MASLSSCVQEFIAQHSSNLFSSDASEARPPRLSRFNSNPLSSTEIEEEDPSTSTTAHSSKSPFDLDLYVITSPIEHFLRVSSRIRREQFFKVVRFVFPLHSIYSAVVDSSWSFTDLPCDDGKLS